MSIFDRFSSQKGKGEKRAKPATEKKAAEKADVSKKAAYKAVPAVASEEKEKKSAPKAAAPSAKATGDAHRVLLSAIVTEKSAMLEKDHQYVFAVAADATKKTVADAVHDVYGVHPVAINIVRLPGKWVRYGRSSGKQVLRKKAVVTMPAGKTIDVVSA